MKILKQHQQKRKTVRKQLFMNSLNRVYINKLTIILITLLTINHSHTAAAASPLPVNSLRTILKNQQHILAQFNILTGRMSLVLASQKALLQQQRSHQSNPPPVLPPTPSRWWVPSGSTIFSLATSFGPILLANLLQNSQQPSQSMPETNEERINSIAQSPIKALRVIENLKANMAKEQDEKHKEWLREQIQKIKQKALSNLSNELALAKTEEEKRSILNFINNITVATI